MAATGIKAASKAATMKGVRVVMKGETCEGRVRVRVRVSTVIAQTSSARALCC